MAETTTTPPRAFAVIGEDGCFVTRGVHKHFAIYEEKIDADCHAYGPHQRSTPIHILTEEQYQAVVIAARNIYEASANPTATFGELCSEGYEILEALGEG